MRKVTRQTLITVAAAGGVLALGAAQAQADSGAHADGATARSAGVLSGNTVHAPVHAPVTVCGNTVSVVGLLSPAAGNQCAGSRSQGTRTKAAAADAPGIGSGNRVEAPVHAPVTVCGNTVSVVGLLSPAAGNQCAAGSGGRTGPGKSDAPGGSAHHGSPGVPAVPGQPGKPSAPGGDDPVPDRGTPEGAFGGEEGSGPVEAVDRSGHAGRNLTPQSPLWRGVAPATEALATGGAQAARVGRGSLATTGSTGLGIALPLGGGLLLGGSLLYRRARRAASGI
ncbi:chaplin [Streptomyces sp. NPDC006879]|uniref:chaplin n=1 Tax=Streptomyces sp. NPDC006879 TaxID=3364767 RepID=UPI0036777840